MPRRWRWTVAIVTLVLASVVAVVLLADAEMPREEMVAKYGGPPSQFVELPSGATAHFRDRGDRDALPLVLLPAMNDSLHQWETWSQILADEFRVVTVDLPGQGLTLAAVDETYAHERIEAFVDEFTRALGLEAFALGGNSFGGLIAARFAILHPRAITHLVLVSAGGVRNSESRPPAAMRIAQTPVVRELLRFVPMRGVFRGYFEEMIVDDRLVTETMVDRYWDLNRGRGAVQLQRLSVFGDRFEAEDAFLRKRLGEVAAPALVMGGQQDAGSPPSSMETYASLLRDARLVLYDGVGHFAMIEVPERSAADVRSFLQERRADR